MAGGLTSRLTWSSGDAPTKPVMLLMIPPPPLLLLLFCTSVVGSLVLLYTSWMA